MTENAGQLANLMEFMDMTELIRATSMLIATGVVTDETVIRDTAAQVARLLENIQDQTRAFLSGDLESMAELDQVIAFLKD